PMASDNNLPFKDISVLPEIYTTENAVARMIDGLGFRFYWATEGLRAEDLAFRPTPESRTSEETIDHIMGLSTVILNCILNQPNTRSGEETSPLSFAEKRKITLENLWQSRQILSSQTVKAEYLNIIFVRKEGNQNIPLWNLINGPIADGLWHVGQVVTFRRSTGNPFNPNVSVLSGKVR
ncbi:MAG: hypothetical protein WAU01_17720, partial [Saprospiraceae bacterium]